MILGLGNPGPRYQQTWHNFGLWIIDGLAKRHGVRFKTFPPHYREGRFQLGPDEVFLVKPLTYVNASGEAVQAFVTEHDTALGDLLVVFDEVELPLGRFRVRAGGSSAGHRGLESIITRLASEAVPRLRCGIGQPKLPKDLSQHVLAKPFPEEMERLSRIVEAAIWICEDWIREGTEKTMNRYNGQKEIV